MPKGLGVGENRSQGVENSPENAPETGGDDGVLPEMFNDSGVSARRPIQVIQARARG